MNLKQDSEPQHIPVMVSEVLSYLNICPDGIYFDGTIGLGGHAKHILSRLNKKGKLIGIDRDGEALEICRKNLQNYPSPILLVPLHHGQFLQVSLSCSNGRVYVWRALQDR